MSKQEINDLAAQFLANGGRVTYCPTRKVGAKTQAKIPNAFSHAAREEAARIARLNGEQIAA